jgi:hypothetical protein
VSYSIIILIELVDKDQNEVKIITRETTSDVQISKKLERYLKLGVEFLKDKYNVVMNMEVVSNGVIYYYLSFEDFVKVIDAYVLMISELMENKSNNSNGEHIRWTLIVEKNDTEYTSEDILSVYCRSNYFKENLNPKLSKTELPPPMDYKIEYYIPKMRLAYSGIVSIFKKYLKGKNN